MTRVQKSVIANRRVGFSDGVKQSESLKHIASLTEKAASQRREYKNLSLRTEGWGLVME